MPERSVPVREIRASDADRERVLAELREALADGRLTLDEHGERMDRACAARTLGELSELTADLLPPERQPIQVDTRPLHVLFGSARQDGRWVVPGRLPVTAMFGHVELDLRAALLQRRHIVVDANVLCGRITLLVPEGVRVVVSGRTWMTTRDVRTRSADAGPIIEVRGTFLAGSIKARTPRRTWRDRMRGGARRAGSV